LNVFTPISSAASEDEHDDEDQREAEVPVGLRVQHAELERTEAGRRLDLGDAARPAQPVGVVRRDADDLAEAERDDGQVVTAQAQCRCAEDEPGEHRDDHGDGKAQQPRQVRVRGG
jgi:hypothetical protein